MRIFDKKQAFSRNLGWITEEEQTILKTKKVAIAGVGGVGGHYCEVLTRLGVENFHIADFDVFELVNFNRQNSSGMSNLGKPKVEVLRQKILDINPEAKIKIFPMGIHKNNISDFLDGIDLYVDGLDFFVLNERLWLFDELRKKGIPGITVGPVAMGASMVVFTKDSMSFSDYFGYTEEMETPEKAVRFLVGLSPSLMHRHYQVDLTRANFQTQKVPSTPMGCFLAAGVAGTTALKLLLNRGDIKAAPWSLHYDAYLQRYTKKYTVWGFKNPIQMLKRAILRKTLLKDSFKAKAFLERDTRYQVNLLADSSEGKIYIKNISSEGIGLELEEFKNIKDKMTLKVVTDDKNTIDVEVEKIWQNDKSCGVKIIKSNQEWDQYIGCLENMS